MLIATAVLISPWLWLAVAVWVGLTVWAIVSFRHHRPRPGHPAITR